MRDFIAVTCRYMAQPDDRSADREWVAPNESRRATRCDWANGFRRLGAVARVEGVELGADEVPSSIPSRLAIAYRQSQLQPLAHDPLGKGRGEWEGRGRWRDRLKTQVSESTK